eukprot:18650_1
MSSKHIIKGHSKPSTLSSKPTTLNGKEIDEFKIKNYYIIDKIFCGSLPPTQIPLNEKESDEKLWEIKNDYINDKIFCGSLPPTQIPLNGKESEEKEIKND